ncbi:hypothetical protein ECZU23_53160 [Escherichia coli]|nr:hypothetical protein ECZU23_53160 [Escherichia coli]
MLSNQPVPISRSSTGMRGLSGGNKIHHIPAGLENYQPYIRSERRVEWIDWQTKGLSFAPFGWLLSVLYR